MLQRLSALLAAALLVSWLHAASIEVSGERLPFNTAEAKKIIAQVEGGDAAGALKEVKKLAKRKPDNIELWMILGSLQAESGEYEDALASLERGLRGRETDLSFLLMQARIHEDRAQLGPGGVRRGGMVQYKASALKAGGEEGFKTTQLRQAAQRYERMVALNSTVKLYQIKHASLLLDSGDAAGALKAAKNYLKDNPGEAELWLQVAKAAMILQSLREAREAAERCIELRGAEAGACRILAQLAEKAGRGEEEARWDRQARFHAFVPDFLPVEFSSENYERVASLLVTAENSTEEQIKTLREQAVAGIDHLIAERTEVSSRLLGIIAWHHDWHGSVENRIYAELESRHAEAVLMALFDRANSYCTVGSTAPALARLHSETAFPLIIERLPTDRNMYSMNLPEALAIYGRPEAVAPLIQALRDALKEYGRVGQSMDPLMGGWGLHYFGERCIWALGQFKSAEARTLLEETAQKKDWAIEANGALFLQSGERRYYEALLRQLRSEPQQAEKIARRFRTAGLSEAQEVESLIPHEKKI